jgi:chaperone modulatory protein CbpM
MCSKEREIDVGDISVVTEEKLTVREICYHTGVETELLLEFVSLGLLEPVKTSPELIFAAAEVLKVNKILRIKRDLEVSLDSMPVVLELLERLEILESELERHRDK